MATKREWIEPPKQYKTIFQGQPQVTGDWKMICPSMGGEITYAPNIKSWGQALAEGGANLIKGVFDGMLAGAMVGVGGAGVGGVRSLLGVGGKEAAKQIGVNFLKSAPRSMLQNIRSGFAGDWAMKGLEATQGWLQTYADTGTATLQNFTDGVKGSSFGDVNAMKNIFTGQATSTDFLAAVFLLLPGNAPGGNKPKSTNNIVDGTPNNKPKDAGGKKKQDGEDGTTVKNRGADTSNKKKKGDNEAYEADKKLLDGEGETATYGELKDNGKPFDDLTGHHMPSNVYMKKKLGADYKTRDGIAMDMEQPHPGIGGRHRKTKTYDNNMTKAEKQAYWDLPPRDALAKDIKDAIKIYKEEGLYNEKIREGLKKVIEENKKRFPDLFKK